MLVKFEDNEDRPGPFGELLSRLDWNDFMGALKTQFFIEPLGEDNVAEHAFRWSVEIVGMGAFCSVLKVRDRHVMGQRQVLSPEQACEEKEEGRGKTTQPSHL